MDAGHHVVALKRDLEICKANMGMSKLPNLLAAKTDFAKRATGRAGPSRLDPSTKKKVGALFDKADTLLEEMVQIAAHGRSVRKDGKK